MELVDAAERSEIDKTGCYRRCMLWELGRLPSNTKHGRRRRTRKTGEMLVMIGRRSVRTQRCGHCPKMFPSALAKLNDERQNVCDNAASTRPPRFGVQVDMHTDSSVTSNIITLVHRHNHSQEIM